MAETIIQVEDTFYGSDDIYLMGGLYGDFYVILPNQGKLTDEVYLHHILNLLNAGKFAENVITVGSGTVLSENVGKFTDTPFLTHILHLANQGKFSDTITLIPCLIINDTFKGKGETNIGWAVVGDAQGKFSDEIKMTPVLHLANQGQFSDEVKVTAVATPESEAEWEKESPHGATWEKA